MHIQELILTEVVSFFSFLLADTAEKHFGQAEGGSSVLIFRPNMRGC